MPIPSSQKALEIVSFGDPLKGSLKLSTSSEVKKPGKGQVLVEMHFACIHPADLFTVMGIYPGIKAVRDQKPGFVGGMEGSGKVVAVGDSVRMAVGTRVVPLLGENAGAWQQYVVVEEKQCLPVPDEVDDQSAAQIFVNPLTVLGMLDEIQEKAPLKENPWVVQTAANSTLGRVFIQEAKRRGIKTINIIRSPATKDELKKLGADEVISVGQEPDVPGRVMKITNGKGASAAVDAVGGDIGTAALASLGKNGYFIAYGLQSGQPIGTNNADLIFKGIEIHGFWLATWLPRQNPSVVGQVLQMLKRKEIQIDTQKTYPLDNYAEAFKAQMEPDRRGKILLQLNE